MDGEVGGGVGGEVGGRVGGEVGGEVGVGPDLAMESQRPQVVQVVRPVVREERGRL